MIKVYLFDWGDTLMVDFPDASGKMCDWNTVKAVAHAKETIAELAETSSIYIATSADDSSEIDIERAFERVGLNTFITGYFCKANVGLSKGTPEFLNRIINKLCIPSKYIAMVGDNFEKDIKPAISVGIQPIWFTNNDNTTLNNNVRVIKCLSELKNNLPFAYTV